MIGCAGKTQASTQLQTRPPPASSAPQQIRLAAAAAGADDVAARQHRQLDRQLASAACSRRHQHGLALALPGSVERGSNGGMRRSRVL